MDPCGGHSHDHDHGDSADDNNSLGLSLRPQIDFTRVTCLNEEVAGSGSLVLKLHEERLTATPSVQSPGGDDGDPELLFYIPFTEAVSIKSICIQNSSNNTATASPRRIKLFCNREDLDFETARELAPQQELELVPPNHFVEGTIDYPLRPAGRFQNISCLSIYIQDNYSSDDSTGEESAAAATEITFVGVKGKGTGMKRMVVEAVYESRGMPKDHKVPGEGFGGRNFL
jgi:PITH domain